MNPNQSKDIKVPLLIVSPAPHIRDKSSTTRIMLDVIIALIPSFAAAVWIFGIRAALVTGVCIASCVLFEYCFEKLLKRKNTVGDLSAVLTGMLLAFNLPVTIPLWQAIVGCFIAIILVKQLFGGIGKNFANPAVTARIVLFIAFPKTMAMGKWIVPFDWKTSLDTVTSATPLALLFKGDIESLPNTWNLFWGNHGGCLGETSELALLIGLIYLLLRRVITPIIPLFFIGTVFILTSIFGGFDFGVYHILSGGLFLGAIFCATDYVTSPITNWGRLIFGIGCGLLTVLIRLYGSYPEGVSFAILIMNILVPYINKFTLKKTLGGIKS